MSYVSRISVKLETVITIETERHPDQITPEDLKHLIVGNTTDTLRQYRDEDVGAAITEHKVISVVEEKKTRPQTCHKCGADLTKPESVSRFYTSKDENHEDAICLGHYQNDTFEPDNKPSNPLDHHDLLDNSDECEECGAVVG